MNPLTSSLISCGLIAGGVTVCAFTFSPLQALPDAQIPLNPFGINRSPFGEVIAMAMQEPIDRYWHGLDAHAHDHSQCEEEGHDHDHDHGPHVHDEHCGHDPALIHDSARVKRPAQGIRDQVRELIDGMAEAHTVRTNPKAPSDGQVRQVRRQIEKKLRFAYQLDPSHYGNYNTYHFFLTEPAIGMHPVLTQKAAQLADDTIRYCLARTDDPRPALTAAAAAANVLELMFNDLRSDDPTFTIDQAKQTLGLLDLALQRHAAIAAEWDRTANWQRLSAMRVQEINDRRHFLNKVRQAYAETIDHLEEDATSQAISH